MRDPFQFPKLRWPVDLSMQEHQGQSVLLLQCPLGIAPQPLGLIPGVAPILREFTGMRSVSDLSQQFAHYGATEAMLGDLIQLLEQHLFLESPAYFQAEKDLKQGYRAAQIRKPALAGLSYAGEQSALARQIAGFVGSEPYVESTARALIGLVAPHIDYRRGGNTYGKAYGHAQNFEHDLCVVLGTSHQYSKHLFHLTEKDFETPLGILPCDTRVVQRLAREYGEERSFMDEFLHKKEHSLELQIPFLQTSHGAVQMVPLLVGSFYSFLRDRLTPSDAKEYEQFAAALSATLADELTSGRRVLFVASVDMAHIGRYFGDEGALNKDRLEHVRERDAAYLAAIAAQDKQALFAHIAEDTDARRVCGFPTMYLLIDVLDRLGLKYAATTYAYEQAVDYQLDCAVTFAAMGLYVQ